METALHNKLSKCTLKKAFENIQAIIIIISISLDAVSIGLQDYTGQSMTHRVIASEIFPYYIPQRLQQWQDF